MARDKVRIRFRKSGDLRFISHHDLMRCFERLLRRADLPYRSSEGFHPKPRLVFASALALGIAGQNEVVDLELADEMPAEEIAARLARHAPPGLDILSTERIPLKTTAAVQRAHYRLSLTPEQALDVPARIAALVDAEACWVERQHPRPRRLDIRPFIHDLGFDGAALHFELNVTPEGSARPEEILKLLGLDAWHVAGAVLERTALEIANPLPLAEPPTCSGALDDPTAVGGAR